jgi:hypothetical protein
MLTPLVNAILGNHNVDKQMTDSRGEVYTDHLEIDFATDGADGNSGCILDG